MSDTTATTATASDNPAGGVAHPDWCVPDLCEIRAHADLPGRPWGAHIGDVTTLRPTRSTDPQIRVQAYSFVPGVDDYPAGDPASGVDGGIVLVVEAREPRSLMVYDLAPAAARALRDALDQKLALGELSAAVARP